MLTLKSFHLLFVAISIVLTAAVGVWGLFNHYQVLGALSLSLSVLLVVYGAYFAAKAQQLHLE
jgi:membrane protein implicated in regulation of membrane protease activity